MLPSERRNKYLELILEKNYVSINELIDRFNVSIETVRRDLNILVKEDKIEKVYGGAKLKLKPASEPDINLRLIGNLTQKDAIGRKCGDLINDGDCIFLDCGTTTYHISKYLKNKNDLTIVTNSILVINELLTTDFDVLIIGGKLRHSERSIIRYHNLSNLEDINIQKCFIGTGGINIENGATDYNMEDVNTRRMIMERSSEIILAADSSKFGKCVTINVAPLDKIDFIVTDDKISDETLASFKKYKDKIIIAK